MSKILILISMMFILVACSSAPQQQRVDISNRLQSCTVYSDKIECLFDDNNIYYATTVRTAVITKWDSSAWKENVAYCPEEMVIENITNERIEQCRNSTTKFCYVNNKWSKCS